MARFASTKVGARMRAAGNAAGMSGRIQRAIGIGMMASGGLVAAGGAGIVGAGLAAAGFYLRSSGVRAQASSRGMLAKAYAMDHLAQRARVAQAAAAGSRAEMQSPLGGSRSAASQSPVSGDGSVKSYTRVVNGQSVAVQGYVRAAR